MLSRDKLKEITDTYINQYVVENSPPRSDANLPDADNARKAWSGWYISDAYKSPLTLEQIQVSNLHPSLQEFALKNLFNNRSTPLKDQVKSCNPAYNIVFLLFTILGTHGFNHLPRLLHENFENLKNHFGETEVYDMDKVWEALNILVRAVCTPNRSLSVGALNFMKNFVVGTAGQSCVFLGMTAQEALTVMKRFLDNKQGVVGLVNLCV